jgi:hypothetical protein
MGKADIKMILLVEKRNYGRCVLQIAPTEKKTEFPTIHSPTN